MEEDGIIMPVVELNCKFLRPALYDDLLTIKTILKEMPTDHKMLFQQEIYNQENKLLTVCKVLLYLINAHTKEKCSLPINWQVKLGEYFNSND
jgi:acyl-CoA thioester hydrolase